MATLESFEELKCWQACKQVQYLVYDITRRLPKQERFDLKSNFVRAARSTTRNIAEGFGRHTNKENVHFCVIARGSLYEVIDDLITCLDCKYIDELEYNKIREKTEEAIKLLNGYIRYLRRTKNQQLTTGN